MSVPWGMCVSGGSCHVTHVLAVMVMECVCIVNVNLDIAVLHGLSVGAGFWDLSQQPLIGNAF